MEHLEHIPAACFTLLARNDTAAFVGLSDGRVVGLRTQHWADAKDTWFLEPLQLERGPLGMVIAPPREGRLNGRMITVSTYSDGESGLTVSVWFELPLEPDGEGVWYVLGDG